MSGRNHKAEWQRRTAKAQALGYTSASAATKARRRERQAREQRARQINEHNTLWKARLADHRMRKANSSPPKESTAK